MKNIAIFASGTGSNAVKIIEYLSNTPNINFRVYSDKPNAGVLKKASELGVPSRVFGKEEFSGSSILLDELKTQKTDLIVLAGFLKKIPPPFLEAFPERIVNIHPSLLPKYGGKGMYGINVHRAVIENREKVSGITIHLIDEEYDRGKHLLQASCDVLPEDSPEELAARVLKLEHYYFPRIAEELINGISQ